MTARSSALLPTTAAATHDFLVAHGVVFIDQAPDARGGNAVGNSVPREMHCAAMDWPMVQTGKPVDPAVRATTSTGQRPDAAAGDRGAKAGVEILLEHRMTALHREAPRSGRVLGIAVENNGAPLNIRARKAVIVATGGSTGNVNFRRMFDPRLTEEYCGLAGMPWSDQDASGEIAAMAVGASLWGLYNQTGEFGSGVTKPGAIGCQYDYQNLRWRPGSAVFDKARAIGLPVNDWQDVIMVNMLGRRFYDETGGQFTANNYNSINPYVQGSYLNAKNIVCESKQLAQRGDGRHRRWPQWRRPDLGDLRRRCLCAREVGTRSRRMSTSPTGFSFAPIASPSWRARS